MIMRTKVQFFSRIGKHMDNILQEAFSTFKDDHDDHKNDPVEDVNNRLNYVATYFASKIEGNMEVEAVKIPLTFEDVLEWVKRHLKGDRFYLVKYTPQPSIIMLYVFFANDDDLYVGDDDPKKWYLCAKLSDSLNDLFANKNVYVQPFKQ